MALVGTKIPVQFRGLETKLDPRQAVPGDLLILKNARFDAPPKIGKRFGYEQIGEASAGRMLATFKNQLLVGTGSRAEAYTPNGEVVDKGSLLALQIRASPAARDIYPKRTPDVAVHPAGVTICTYESVESGNVVARYTALNTATGQPLVRGVSLVSTSGTGVNTAPRPKPFVLGKYVIVIAYDGSSQLVYRAIDTTDPRTVAASGTLTGSIATAPPVWDGVVVEDPYGTDHLWVFYTNASNEMRHISLSEILTVGASASTISPATSGAVTALGVCRDGLMADVGVVYTNATREVRFFTMTPGGAIAWSCVFGTPPDAPIRLGVSVGPAWIGGRATVGVVAETGGGVSKIVYHRERTFLPNESPADTSFVASVRDLTLASKPFYYNGVLYYLGAFVSTFQTTYFLMEAGASGAIPVGKLAPGVGGGTPVTATLPEVVTVSAEVKALAYLQADQLIATGTSIFTQFGAQIARLTFNAPQFFLETMDSLLITGGIMHMYDGQQVCELGFHVYPEGGLSQVTGTGASTAGEYKVCFAYRWMDAYGQIHQSAPSPALSVTSTGSQQFQHVIPTLKLTSRSTPVSIVVYRTMANQSVFYEVTDPTSPLLNDPTVDATSTFTENYSDVALAGRAQLLWNPLNVLAEVPSLAPPAPAFLTRYRNRAVIIPAESPNQWVFSKEIIPGVPVEFNHQQFYQAVQGSGDLTGAAEMDDKIILFRNGEIYYTAGNGPAPNGTSSDYLQPMRLPSDVGCVNPKSLALTPDGVFFESAKGLYRLSRAMQIEYIGAPVEKWAGTGVVSATVSNNSRRTMFCLESKEALVYDDFVKRWALWTNHQAVDSLMYGSLFVYLTADGRIMQETPGLYTDAGAAVLLGLTTSWLSFAGISGAQRVWRLIIRGDYRSRHHLVVGIAFDDNPAIVQTMDVDAYDLLTPGPEADTVLGGMEDPGGGLYPYYEWQVKLAKQRCSSMQITIQETQPHLPHGEGFALSALTFLVGEESGLHKVSAKRSIT